MDFEIEPPPTINRLDRGDLGAIGDDVVESALINYVFYNLMGDGEGLEAIADWPDAMQAWYIAFAVDAGNPERTVMCRPCALHLAAVPPNERCS